MKLTETKKTLSSFFPVPKFLKMEAVGIDISDQRIRFLKLKRDKDILKIDRYGEIDVPAGVVESGNIKKPDELKKILTQFGEKYETEFARVSLPEERAYLVSMQTPLVEGEELRNAIAFQIEEHVPLPADSVVFDYEVLKEKPGRDGGHKEVLVSVFPKKDVESYINLFSDTGIVPLSFEIEAQAIARATTPKGSKGTFMIVDFGKERTRISITHNELVRFTSTIDVGSDMITRAIEKEFSVSTKEANKIKNQKSLSKSKENEKFFTAILSSVSVLRDEINRLYIYWQTHIIRDKESMSIDKIILCGGGANLKGLPEYLSTSLKIEVVVADPWVNIGSYENYIPEIPLNSALGYVTAIGLVLPGK